MKIEQAVALKRAVTYLYKEVDGQELIAFMEDIAGYYTPNYDPSNQTSITLAAGRTEMMQTLRNLNRLTPEQIQDLCQEGQSDE